MTDQAFRHRRHPEQVVGSAAVVGLASGLLIAVLSVLVPLFVRALVGGASLSQAFGTLAITDAEDWELIPVFLGGAIMVGALISVASVVVWWEIATRLPGRPWLAQLGAAGAAAASSLLVLAGTTSWSIAAPAAVAAGLVAAVAAPLVGYVRPRRQSAPA